MDKLEKSKIKFYGYCFALGIVIASFFIFIFEDYHPDSLLSLFWITGVIQRMSMERL